MNMMPIIDTAGTGRNIAVLRKKAGLTVSDLQDIFGFGTPQAIYKWQRGTALPSIDNLVVLADVFGKKVLFTLAIPIRFTSSIGSRMLQVRVLPASKEAVAQW